MCVLLRGCVYLHCINTLNLLCTKGITCPNMGLWKTILCAKQVNDRHVYECIFLYNKKLQIPTMSYLLYNSWVLHLNFACHFVSHAPKWNYQEQIFIPSIPLLSVLNLCFHRITLRWGLRNADAAANLFNYVQGHYAPSTGWQ